MVQAVAARARTLSSGDDPLQLAARSRVQTRLGAWLLLYGTPLAGGGDRRTAVILQPATPDEVAPWWRWHTGSPNARARSSACACKADQPRRWSPASMYLPTRCRTTSSRSRQDRCSEPQRARRPDLPRALRSPLGRRQRPNRMAGPVDPTTNLSPMTTTADESSYTEEYMSSESPKLDGSRCEEAGAHPPQNTRPDMPLIGAAGLASMCRSGTPDNARTEDRDPLTPPLQPIGRSRGARPMGRRAPPNNYASSLPGAR